MRFPTMWYVRPAKPQISLCICEVWSEPMLVPWIFYDYSATERTSFVVSKLNSRLHSLVWVYTLCHGSYCVVLAQVLHLVVEFIPRIQNALQKTGITMPIVCATLSVGTPMLAISFFPAKPQWHSGLKHVGFWCGHDEFWLFFWYSNSKHGFWYWQIFLRSRSVFP